MSEKKQSISAIREIFAAASETELPALYLEYEEDSRAGVQNLIQKCLHHPGNNTYAVR